MNSARSNKEHWKELVAIARDKKVQPAEDGSTGQTGGKKTPEKGPPRAARWTAANRFYREYFERYRYVWLGGSLVILAICLGMAFGPDGRPSRVHVSGQVLLDEKPLTNATIVFMPREGRSAVATLDEQGRFVLSCFGGEDGAIPGSYRLEIAMTQAPGKTDPPWPVPKIYTNYETSGLTAEITNSTRDLVIRLTSAEGTPPAQGGNAVPPVRPASK